MNYIHITEDEIDKRRQELRDKRAQAEKNGDVQAMQEFDRFTVKKAQAGMYYRGVKNDPLSLARAAAKGLVPVQEKDEESWVLERTEKGLKVNGDLALFKMPRERHVDRRIAIEDRRKEVEEGFMATKREELNRLARNTLRGKPHTDYTIDTSVQGETQTAVRQVVKQPN